MEHCRRRRGGHGGAAGSGRRRSIAPPRASGRNRKGRLAAPAAADYGATGTRGLGLTTVAGIAGDGARSETQALMQPNKMRSSVHSALIALGLLLGGCATTTPPGDEDQYQVNDP